MTVITRRGFSTGIVALAAAPAVARSRPATLIRGVVRVLTMDAARGEMANADILVRDGTIVAIGSALSAPGPRSSMRAAASRCRA